MLQNTVIERIRPEVNHRVNYPLKQVVIRIKEQGRINVDDRTTTFCVSFILVHVAGYGVSVFSQAWNMHFISGTCTYIHVCSGSYMLGSDVTGNLCVCISHSCLDIHTGKGIPNKREKQKHGVTPLPPHSLPSTEVAKQMYLEHGGNLRAFSVSGRDPLRNRQDLVLRRDGLFNERNPSWQQIFSNVASHDGKQLEDAILSFIDITRSFEQML